MAKIELETAPISTLTAGSSISGNVSVSGDFRLDGTLNGDITLNGKLVVGEGGIINGNIICQNANIMGAVNGNISVKELLSLHATARVRGDILINRLSIEPGALYAGNCRILDEVKKSTQQETVKENASK
ncbi:MAG: polymer-forming cytoskeletal protein [Bacteroidales bacterium]|nr:polymer-forming cytoskeletal protein [Bacteroidales bacterium]